MALYTELLGRLSEAEQQEAYRYLWLRGRLHQNAVKSGVGLAIIAASSLLVRFTLANEPSVSPNLDLFMHWAPVLAAVLCGASSAVLLLQVLRQKQALRDLQLSGELIQALSKMPVRHFA